MIESTSMDCITAHDAPTSAAALPQTNLLEDVLWREVQNLFHDKQNLSSPESLESIKIRVFKRVAKSLNLSIVDDLYLLKDKHISMRIVLSKETSRQLDNVWNRIMINRGSDSKISFKDKIIRDVVLSKAYVEKSSVIKFINILLRKDSMTSNNTTLLKSNAMNVVLAVDGFGGILTRDYKNYVDNLNDLLPERIKKHVAGVRAMYDYFHKNVHDFPDINGTETTCIVFLTLLNLYRDRVGSRIEDCKKLLLDRLEKFIVNFMDLISNNNVHDPKSGSRKYRRLRHVYCQHVSEDEHLDWIALEKINGGENFILLQQHLQDLHE